MNTFTKKFALLMVFALSALPLFSAEKPKSVSLRSMIALAFTSAALASNNGPSQAACNLQCPAYSPMRPDPVQCPVKFYSAEHPCTALVADKAASLSGIKNPSNIVSWSVMYSGGTEEDYEKLLAFDMDPAMPCPVMHPYIPSHCKATLDEVRVATVPTFLYESPHRVDKITTIKVKTIQDGSEWALYNKVGAEVYRPRTSSRNRWEFVD